MLMINPSKKEKANSITVSDLRKLLLILFLFLQSCSYQMFPQLEKVDFKDQVTIETAKEVEELFLPVINSRLKKAGIKTLRDEKMQVDSKEIHFWVGFSQNRLKGLILRGDKENWSAIYIPQIDESLKSSSTPRLLPPPQNGWVRLLKKMQEWDIYTLPGESVRVPGRLHIYDGISIVVEAKTSTSYRAYQYYGLLYYKEPQTTKMEAIIATLSAEFMIEMY